MKPFEKTRLLKPLISNVELTEPEWMDEECINFYIPIWFNPDEHFDGLHVNTDENDDYINLYLNYYPTDDRLELYIDYANNSGRSEGYQDFGIDAEMDEETEQYLRTLLAKELVKFNQSV